MDITQSIPFDIGSVRNEAISTFWAQIFALKESMKFTEIYEFHDFSTINN